MMATLPIAMSRGGKARDTSPLWRMVVGGVRSATEQMALDEELAQEAIPTVRLFTWDPPAISLGWKQPCPDWLKTPRWRAGGLEVVERPTGGGMAFHGSDLSVGVIVPRALGMPLEALMRTICQSATRLCHACGADAHSTLRAMVNEVPEGRIAYCLTEPSPYAVFVGERKVAGFALRRYPKSWLVQGSLLIQPLPRALSEAMPADVVRRVETRATALACVATASLGEAEVAQRWAEHWSSWWG